MAPRTPRITSAELVRALRRDGWYEHHQEGSHLVLRHTGKAGRVVVPMHAGQALLPGLLTSILREAGLTVDELRRLL